MFPYGPSAAARRKSLPAQPPEAAKRPRTNFSVKWLEKDMQLMVDSAQELGVPVPTTETSRQQLEKAIQEGYGDEDICGSIHVLEGRTGLTVASKTA